MVSKSEAKSAQGLAALCMVLLHLFCTRDMSVYNVHFYVGQVPLLYYFGLLSDICLPIYCFCSGYAQAFLSEKDRKTYRISRLKRLLKFLTHFWIILCVFSIIGLIVRDPTMIVNAKTFFGNFLLYSLSYNGAWWFITAYIFLILIYPAIEYLFKRFSIVLCLSASLAVYMIAYIIEFKLQITTDIHPVDFILNTAVRIGRTQLPFVIGIFYYKKQIITRLKNKLSSKAIKYTAIILSVAAVSLLHCKIQSLVLAPINALVVVTGFYLWNKPCWVQRVFLFLGRHSTNIWLTHMFFYLCLFPGLVYKAKEPILVLLFMLAICIVSSYFIDLIETLLRKFVTAIKAKIFDKKGTEA